MVGGYKKEVGEQGASWKEVSKGNRVQETEDHQGAWSGPRGVLAKALDDAPRAEKGELTGTRGTIAFGSSPFVSNSPEGGTFHFFLYRLEERFTSLKVLLVAELFIDLLGAESLRYCVFESALFAPNHGL